MIAFGWLPVRSSNLSEIRSRLEKAKRLHIIDDINLGVTQIEALLEMIEKKDAILKDASEFLKMWIDDGGFEHEDPQCPEDDTCECENVQKMNAIFKAIGREGEGVKDA